MGLTQGRFAHRTDLGGRGPADILKWRFGRVPGDPHELRPRWDSIPFESDTSRIIRESGDRDAVTWFGHASALVRLEGVKILIDPVEGSVPFVRRRSPDAPIFASVPNPNAILITHNHFDHMDERTLLRFERGTPVFVPIGMGEWFEARGFTRVRELDWWEAFSVENLNVKFLPARHWSKRSLFDTMDSLWGGYHIASSTRSVYHAGDSGYFGGFKEIGKRFGAVDIAMIPIGAYSPRWFMQASHLCPEEALAVAREVHARRMIPIHYGSFILSDEPMGEPPALLEAEARRTGDRRVLFPPIGGTVFPDELGEIGDHDVNAETDEEVDEFLGADDE